MPLQFWNKINLFWILSSNYDLLPRAEREQFLDPRMNGSSILGAYLEHTSIRRHALVPVETSPGTERSF